MIIGHTVVEPFMSSLLFCSPLKNSGRLINPAAATTEMIIHIALVFMIHTLSSVLIRLNRSINSSALGFRSLMNLSLKTIKPTTKRSVKIIRSISFNLLSFSVRAIENNVLSRSNVADLSGRSAKFQYLLHEPLTNLKYSLQDTVQQSHPF